MGHSDRSSGCAECSRSRIWTESERRLVLVRDRLGIKPLYIHQRGDDLYFGSELKTLFVHPEIERRIDLDGLNLLSFAELYSRPVHAGRRHSRSCLRRTGWNGRTDGRDRSAYWQLELRSAASTRWMRRRKNSTLCCRPR